MNHRNTAIGKLHHLPVKFGNDFCIGLKALQYKAEEAAVFGQRKYIYPIFEILN
ncbi:hypothetical protein FQZ97_937530 [compost metagenome]